MCGGAVRMYGTATLTQIGNLDPLPPHGIVRKVANLLPIFIAEPLH